MTITTRDTNAYPPHCPSTTAPFPTVSAQIRTDPNKFEQNERRSRLKEPEGNRKNLKKPESLQRTISSKTLEIRALRASEKEVHLKPETRRSSRPTPDAFFSDQGRFFRFSGPPVVP